MTPHNKAQKKDIASIVLLPGCPLRAKYISENYLDDAVLVNDVRNMYAYTGTYKGKKITVMGSGIGVASAGIYSWELFSKQFYDVNLIIRVGSCGTYKESINIGDILIVKSTYSKSYYAEQMNIQPENNTLHTKPELIKLAQQISCQQKIQTKLCQSHCSDAFYEVNSIKETIKKTNSDVVEMESFVLLLNAQIHKKNAITLLTCSDNLISETQQKLSHKDREQHLDQMIKIGLEMAHQYEYK